MIKTTYDITKSEMAKKIIEELFPGNIDALLDVQSRPARADRQYSVRVLVSRTIQNRNEDISYILRSYVHEDERKAATDFLNHKYTFIEAAADNYYAERFMSSTAYTGYMPLEKLISEQKTEQGEQTALDLTYIGKEFANLLISMHEKGFAYVESFEDRIWYSPAEKSMKIRGFAAFTELNPVSLIIESRNATAYVTNLCSNSTNDLSIYFRKVYNENYTDAFTRLMAK